MAMASDQAIKVRYSGALCRVCAAKPTNGAIISFGALEDRLRSSFKLSPEASLSLTYTDGDGDVVNLACDLDLVDALASQKQNNLPVDLTVRSTSGGPKADAGDARGSDGPKDGQGPAAVEVDSATSQLPVFSRLSSAWLAKEWSISSAQELTSTVDQIFDEALSEPTLSEIYAAFCKELSASLPEFNEGGEIVRFKRVLVNKCQEFFTLIQDEVTLEEEERGKEEKKEREGKVGRRARARLRRLGYVQFVGELLKVGMLTPKVIHHCIRGLFHNHENPKEVRVESLCLLLMSVGESIDTPQAAEHMKSYMGLLSVLANDKRLPPRIHFMLRHIIRLRESKWQGRQ